MSFEDINIGDIVFVKKEVVFGFSVRRSFFIPVKVERLTKKMFYIEGESDRFYKRNGRRAKADCHGGVYKCGESDGPYSLPVSDQTNEMNDFKRLLRTSIKNKVICDNIISLKDDDEVNLRISFLLDEIEYIISLNNIENNEG